MDDRTEGVRRPVEERRDGEKGGDVRARLQGAALAPFRERGYDRTTAAEIAARAGVTERTFFRYFPNKREVLFDGEAFLRSALTAAVADAPDGLGPLDALFRSFRPMLPALEGNRAYANPREDLIAATPALHERELAKTDALADALADAVRARGVADLPAALAARTGMAAFVHVTIRWLGDPAHGLGDGLNAALRELKALVTGSGAADRAA